MLPGPKLFWQLKQRSQLTLARIIASNYVDTCRAQSSYKKHGSSGDKDRFKEYSYTKYSTPIAIIASVIGFYYLSTPSLKTTYALTKTKETECGELRKDLQTYTLEEVSQHDDKKKGIWVTFKRGVYDITNFVEKHPGGPSKIMMAAGGSIDPFWMIFANHNTQEIYDILESMRIGNISEEDAQSNGSNLDDPYAKDPKRHRALKANGNKPYCAEPPPFMLAESFITPTELFYVRNHLPVPEIDLENYTLELDVDDTSQKSLNFEEIRKYPKYTITSAIMCGGNRRSEMAQAKPLKGLSWGIGAIGNATWSGARLCDVLKDLGINEDDYAHVQFEGHDLDPSGTPYGASIPISRAMDPRADVILAYEMNGQPISRDHGFPIRVVVPGVVGARNVKWLARIVVSKDESPSQWQQGDYKGFSPSTDWNNVDFSKAPAIQEMPVISAICTPQPAEIVKVIEGKIDVKGYAWSGGGRKIIRVDVTNDKGNTWHIAELIGEDSNAKEGRYWSWTLWKIQLPVSEGSEEIEIWAKAVDASYNVQPEDFKNIWNLRGLLCNAYHRVKINVQH
ncbi:hypothetical protein KM043_003220 [Ampulex compressa]|nr:hypothetical protein KM043_003220 [Ampulex compressa]